MIGETQRGSPQVGHPTKNLIIKNIFPVSMAFFGTMHGIPHFNDPSESQSPPALSRGLMPLFDVQMEAEETAEGIQLEGDRFAISCW